MSKTKYVYGFGGRKAEGTHPVELPPLFNWIPSNELQPADLTYGRNPPAPSPLAFHKHHYAI